MVLLVIRIWPLLIWILLHCDLTCYSIYPNCPQGVWADCPYYLETHVNKRAVSCKCWICTSHVMDGFKLTINARRLLSALLPAEYLKYVCILTPIFNVLCSSKFLEKTDLILFVCLCMCVFVILAVSSLQRSPKMAIYDVLFSLSRIIQLCNI